MTLIAGIDYSMTSPSCCIEKDGEFYYLCLNGRKKLQGKYSIASHHIFIDEPPPNAGNMNSVIRYSFISKKFIDFLESFGEDILVGIEGYSYGSKGRAIFNIAENTQTLKIRITNSPKLRLVDFELSPKTIKKFATDNGNADKELMHQFWSKKSGIDSLCDHIGVKDNSASPVSDIVDSYWIQRYIYHKLENKK